jgi:hypothetical protein
MTCLHGTGPGKVLDIRLCDFGGKEIIKGQKLMYILGTKIIGITPGFSRDGWKTEEELLSQATANVVGDVSANNME